MELKRRLPIGVELVKRGVVTEQDIEKALDYQRTHPNIKLGDILHVLHVCDDERLIQNIGDITGQKAVLLTANALKVKPTDYLPLEDCKKNKCLPFEVEGNKIKVAFSDKSVNDKDNSIKMQFLNKGLVMEEYITFEQDIEKILKTLEGVPSNNIVKTTTSGTIVELVDNIIFIGLAFIFAVPIVDVVIMIITHWLLSLVWICIAQPFTERTVKWASKDAPAEA